MPRLGKNHTAAVLTVLFACASLQASASTAARGETVRFEGVWSTKWCDTSRPDSECGGFTALLVQQGDRLCGRFSGVRPGVTQVDEGGPQSVRGLVVNGTAVVAAMSGRNEGTYLVRLDREGQHLRWRLLEQVGSPDNGDIQLIALDEVLTPENGVVTLAQLAMVREECVFELS